MTANELAQLLFKRWNGDDVEIPPNLDDLCSEMLQKQQSEIEALKRRKYIQTEIISRYKDMLNDADFEIQKWKSKHDVLAVRSCACGLKKASEK